jgi:TorA maturation chaperone TorD
MGPSTADVRRTYISAGLDLSQTNTELPDHIATEMEFMHFLCAEEARNMKIGNTKEATRMRQLQREFHKNHVGVWVDDFADCILHATTSPFYRTAANVLKKYAHDESGYFDGE